MATADLFLAQTRENDTREWQAVGGFCETVELATEELHLKAPKGRQYRVLQLAATVIDPPAPPLVAVTSVTPATAVVGGPDVTMSVGGSGFTPTTQIVWNGAPEPTVYVSPTEVTTVVKPSTASGPATIPVGVTGSSQTQSFTFTAA